MAQQIADRRDVDFLLHEVLRVEEISGHEKFGEFNRKTIDLIISEARNLALKEVLPTQVIGDRQGVLDDRLARVVRRARLEEAAEHQEPERPIHRLR